MPRIFHTHGTHKNQTIFMWKRTNIFPRKYLLYTSLKKLIASSSATLRLVTCKSETHLPILQSLIQLPTYEDHITDAFRYTALSKSLLHSWSTTRSVIKCYLYKHIHSHDMLLLFLLLLVSVVFRMRCHCNQWGISVCCEEIAIRE